MITNHIRTTPHIVNGGESVKLKPSFLLQNDGFIVVYALKQGELDIYSPL